MAYTKLDDVIVRELWTPDFIDESPELQNIIDSGLLTTDEKLNRIVNATEGGSTFELPYIADPSYVEPEIMDDSEDEIAPQNISWATQYAMLGMYAQSWKESTIVKALSDKDPVAFIRDSYVAKYWAMDLVRRIMGTVSGVAADNVANDNSDLVLDVSSDATGGATTDVTLDMGHTVDACGLLGDKQDKFEFMFMHSKVYGDIKKAQLIETIIPSEGGKPIYMYGQYRVIVNDLLPVVQGINKKSYISVIAQAGALAYSNKNLPEDMPSIDLVTNKLAGMGSGSKQLVARRGQVVHPIGWSFDKANVVGQSPTLAELNNALAWDRKFQQKNSKFVFVITN